MISDREKKEMREDGFNPKRRQEFLKAEQQKHRASRALNDYIAFLMDVQKIKPFEHKHVITPTGKNIL